MNIIEIAGHLGADPVTRFTATGQKVTTFNVATNSKKGGADVTIWFRVTVWGDRFDKMMTYLKKGSAVIIVGELQKPEIWTDKEGKSQISLDVTAEMIRFSPFGKPDRQEQQHSHHQSSNQSFDSGTSQHGQKQKSREEFDEEEVPF